MNINTINNQPKYIDPMSDFAFKRIFASDPNKDLLITFLNEVLRGQKQIVNLVYNKNEHQGDTKDEGGAIFDLLCTGNAGEKFIIEIQRSRQKHFKERAVFYNSKLICEQAPRGRRGSWGYQLKEVYLIALLDGFTLNDTSGKYIHDICLCDKHTGEIFYHKLGYTFIELRKFVKTDSELETDLDKWLYVLKNMSNMDRIPLYLKKPMFEKLFNIAEYSNLTKEEKMSYDSSQKRRWDNQNVLDYAKEEGLAKGRHEAYAEAARKLKEEGIQFDLIAKATSLSIEEIEKL